MYQTVASRFAVLDNDFPAFVGWSIESGQFYLDGRMLSVMGCTPYAIGSRAPAELIQMNPKPHHGHSPCQVNDEEGYVLPISPGRVLQTRSRGRCCCSWAFDSAEGISSGCMTLKSLVIIPSMSYAATAGLVPNLSLAAHLLRARHLDHLAPGLPLGGSKVRRYLVAITPDLSQGSIRHYLTIRSQPYWGRHSPIGRLTALP